MEVCASQGSFSELSEGALVVFVFEGDTSREGVLATLNDLTDGCVAGVFETGEIHGKRDQWVFLHKTGRLRSRRLMLYGAGKLVTNDNLQMRRVAGAAARTLAARGVRSAAFVVRNGLDVKMSVRAIVEGVLLGQMNSHLYRSAGKPDREIERLVVVSESPADFRDEMNVGRIMAEATNFARVLGNEPGNVMTPSELARRAAEMAEREGLTAEVLGEEEMERLGMGALLAVSRGSAEPARLIVITYTPAGMEPRDGSEMIALIGKGLTFDSGGISIKPADKMDEMKFDMCGGAAVIGAMRAIARLRPHVRVIGIVPSSENLPSGRACKPGDVVRSMSGKTIEVVDTDAEGRLILADAITYTISRGASHLVDVATLTGACVVALGEVRAGIMGTDQLLIDDLVSAGEESGERLWQMPVEREYDELIRSDIADVKNVGNRTAGGITGGMFLKSFTASLPWAHLDIAGTAWLEKAKPYMAKGATGFGVRTLANLALRRGAKTC